MEKDNVTKMKRAGTSELSRFIEFSLGHEDYAIPLLMVREVISVPDTTPIPKSPTHFLGIMNLRGQVISVVDLRKKLKVDARQDKEEAVIIVDIGGMNIGVVVDSINKVLAFSSEDVSEMPEVEHQINTHFIFGVYKKENSLTVLLDIAKVLDLKDMEAISGTKRAA
ncbi:chemotaxis protein CheW [Bacteriovorax stolpii]|uniref:Chemotaxis protein CheW n=1 Tax=Bacteriovorax stolpii TaxID=960 RepID=A0A2K9NQR2_BACTC|nr:chemotaxis protein CheW [Bacteriovorax stolpii]AUN97870.1 chemotaxis protein CheW [Bacteriovorax stolpii]TDP51701.1 purine-binding chemotaxis protein CheW [Bacteriovorax stolpii]